MRRSATRGRATQGGSNDNTRRGLSAVDPGRRGLGPQGGGLRDAERAGQLPRVRRPAPPARRRRRGPAARRGLRVRARDRAGPDPRAPPAAASTPRPGWSRWPGTATRAADIRVGDMHALPWDDASFDVVTSFRGIWGTTPDAVTELRRVLRPGGRAGITVWGHIKVSPGAWALAPFRLAAPPKVDNQAAMVSLGRPGAGEQLLAAYGFADIERIRVPFVWEFADPQLYARALAADRPRLRGHPERRRGRIPARGGRAGRRDGYGTACRCGPKSTSWATWPANPRKHADLSRQERPDRCIWPPRASSLPVNASPRTEGWGVGQHTAKGDYRGRRSRARGR